MTTEYCSRCDREWSLDVHDLCRIAGAAEPAMPCVPIARPDHEWHSTPAFGSGSGGVECARCGAWASILRTPAIGPCAA